MNILPLLIVVSLIVAVLFLALFIYQVKKGQIDDLDTPAIRMLKENHQNTTHGKV